MVEEKLKFQPYSSILNPGFWQQLTNIKLNKLKLSKDPIDIYGSYSCNLSETLPCLASFDNYSFNEFTEPTDRSSSSLHGKLVCTNIMQEFLDYDKKKFLNDHGLEIWQSICDGKSLIDPEKYLSRFGLLVFADLKKYKFYYWFCFPAVNYPSSDHDLKATEATNITSIFSQDDLMTIQQEYDNPHPNRGFSRGYFIIKLCKNAPNRITIHPLTQYEEATTDTEIFFAYSDPSSNPKYPGWPLRNFLCLIAVQFRLSCANIVRIRRGQPLPKSRLNIHHSLVSRVVFKLNSTLELPLITGWEKDESQNLAPKRVDLSKLLDPQKLAKDAVNLNLRLMKWRLLPGLDLDKIASSKCLLLGCGTLGCHVARGLLAWGVTTISIVDNGRISYSNPVRQTLYTFDDGVGVFKAEAAVASLKKIHPSVNVQAHVFSIPMPGHHIDAREVDQTKRDISTLENLIQENDVIFLLMDTRESRWLPTVIAMSKQKLVINAAIGFDTYLLQRYGIRDYSSVDQATPDLENTKGPSQLSSDKLGCYFCNDIVAPGDSTQDRTLDQQCTVSRPGVSMMVSAMAVELFASVVSSRMGPLTPAPINFDVNSDDEVYGSELGIVPHSIRGNLARYYTYMPTSPHFNKCSACSKAVIRAYLSSGYEFLQRVFDDPNYLEEVAGLKDLQNVSDNVWALESDEDDENLCCIEDKRC